MKSKSPRKRRNLKSRRAPLNGAALYVPSSTRSKPSRAFAAKLASVRRVMSSKKPLNWPLKSQKRKKTHKKTSIITVMKRKRVSYTLDYVYLLATSATWCPIIKEPVSWSALKRK